MQETDKTGAVCEAIGRYYCAFSQIEHELGQAIKVIFGIDRLKNADVIVACLGDFTRKLNVVWSGIQHARMADGSEPDAVWKASSEDTMKKMLGVNEKDRVLLAHAHLEPLSTGVLKLTRMTSKGVLKITPYEWPLKDLERKREELDKLAKAVRSITEKLNTLTFPIDIPDGAILQVADAAPSAGTSPTSPE